MTDHISRVAIYYISGTGNAASAATWIADEVTKAGITVSVNDIGHKEYCKPSEPIAKQITGFVYPTHGFNAIPAMIYFLLKMPAGKGTRAFLVNTRGGLKMGRFFINGATGVALLMPAFILLMKGYRMIGFRPVDLPSNWSFLHPGIRSKVVDSIYSHWEKHVRNFAVKIIAGKKVWRGLYSLPVDIALVPIALGYYLAGRFFLAKTFVAGTSCDNCGLCIRECPTESITMVDGRPYWKLTCESCMRCFNRCPKKAIQTTQGMAVLFWTGISWITGLLIAAVISLFDINKDSDWWIAGSAIIHFGVIVSSVWVFYLITHMLQRYKIFRLVIEYTSLSRLPFWRRYVSPWYRRKTNSN